MNKDLQDLRAQFIEEAGHATQSIGFGRILGQIFAYLYFSPTPQTLDDLTAGLDVSKGSASMAVRQLESWGALRKVWRKGDRKDYYETRDEFGRIIRKALMDMVGQRMETADHLLERAEGELVAKPRNGAAQEPELVFFRQRVGKLRAFRRRAQGLLDSPVIRMLMK